MDPAACGQLLPGLIEERGGLGEYGEWVQLHLVTHLIRDLFRA